MSDLYRLSFYVPETHLNGVKAALFAVGAGRFNGYDQCVWQVRGEGQFRPLAGSQPFLGEIEKLQHVVEYKVEMVCTDAVIQAAIHALLDAHPYQQPAYSVHKILTADDFDF